MALNLDDLATDSLARQVARLTGESLTEAVRTSLSERLHRERLKRGNAQNLEEDIDAIVKRVAALPVLDGRSPDAIIGYDENGLPA